jgi:hypothetical protein
MVKGVGLRLLSRRGSWVQIPPSAPFEVEILNSYSLKKRLGNDKVKTAENRGLFRF